GWDYLAVDPQSKLLYISRGDHVIVVDTSQGKQVADITGLHGTHGVVFSSRPRIHDPGRSSFRGALKSSRSQSEVSRMCGALSCRHSRFADEENSKITSGFSRLPPG